MAKKKKGGDDGGGGGKGKKKGKALEKVSFNTRMKDFKERLDRQVELCAALEDQNRIYQSHYEKEVQDKSDCVEYLKSFIVDQSVKITELQEQLLGFENATQSEKDDYEKKLQDLADEFADTKEKLTAENMTLNGKLALVEEFRLQKDGILQKLADAEQEVVDQTTKFRNQLRTIEQQTVKDREMLKKEMAERVENLAAEFRKASDKQLSFTVKQAIDETVRANWQIKKTTEMAMNITDTNFRLKEREAELKRQIDVRDSIERHLSSRAQGQDKVISLLQDKCEMQKLKIIEFEKLQKQFDIQNDALMQMEKDLSGAMDEIKYMKDEKDDMAHEVDVMEEELAKRSAVNEQLVSILRTAAKIIKCEMMSSSQVTEDEPPKRKKIIGQLIALLESGSNLKDQEPIFPTSSSKDLFASLDADYSNVNYEEMVFYEPGDFGVMNIPGTSSASSKPASPSSTSALPSPEIFSISSRADQDVVKPKKSFNNTAGKILSDIGLLNKLMKKKQQPPLE